jgi:phenylpropionate dioxygenase-like ring-hydroxylating dioxygenase large terminal subunit
MAWVRLLPADAVAPEGIASVEVGDLDLVVWRDMDGRHVVMDARCPHQWSHLEAEGVVDGHEIVCAAHFWRFDADGVGTKLSVLGRRDRKGDTTVYPCRTVEGMLEADLGDAAAEGAEVRLLEPPAPLEPFGADAPWPPAAATGSPVVAETSVALPPSAGGER